MRTVYMVMHQRKPNFVELSRQISAAFSRAGMELSTEQWLWDRIGETGEKWFAHKQPQECEAIVSVGGDGTLLRANAVAAEHDLPLLGINVGTVGFLAELELERLDMACETLREDRYTLEERMMLKASIGPRTLLALNDVVLSRGGYTRLIGVNAWAGEEHIGRYNADGLIIATPTGSTGYSLSAGGPIVCPEVECILLTPICAHSLQHRPVITSATQHIKVRLDQGYTQRAMISVDGRQTFELIGDQELVVTRAERYTRFIRLEPRSFFSTIRYKLSEWSCQPTL